MILENNFGYVKKARSTFIFFTCLMAAFPILSFGIRSVVTILWGLIGLLCAYYNYAEIKASTKKESVKNLMVYVLPYLLLLVSLLYSENSEDGIKKLTQMLSLVIFPVVFLLNQNILSRKVLNYIIITFCSSVIVFVLYQYVLVGLNFQDLFSPLTEQEIKRNNLHHINAINDDQINQVKLRRVRSFIVEKVGSHPTYQGLWIAFTLYFLGQTIIKRKNQKGLVILGSAIFVALVFWIVLLSARAPILMAIAAFFICLLLFSKLTKRTYLVLSLGLFTFLALLYGLSDQVQTKTHEISENLFKLPSKGNDIYNFNSTNVRNGIYYCAVSTIKENLLIGVGIGDAQQELNTCYNEKIGAKIYRWHTFNTHNQYLFFLLSTGIFGLFAFLMTLYISFRRAFSINERLFFFFMILVAMSMLTENIISRSDGIIFFSLFTCIILFCKREALRL